MHFLGLGMPELVVILIVILIIFGPKNLPKLGKAIGRSVKGVRQGFDEANKEIKEKDAAATDDGAAEPEVVEAAEEPAQKRPAKKTTKKKAA
ncbi:MAG: twin-arginine translocase TatA/TatE family subunit [Coriobacteriales bacterium]|jgi:sec-independent protein translocase protein TatA|nr:twin-arginine translocase TatA/TatE family subunit [Coriobacteriales bacterium]